MASLVATKVQPKPNWNDLREAFVTVKRDYLMKQTQEVSVLDLLFITIIITSLSLLFSTECLFKGGERKHKDAKQSTFWAN